MIYLSACIRTLHVVAVQVALESQALRQRLLEDRLAAEMQAAEQSEALAGSLGSSVDGPQVTRSLQEESKLEKRII